MGRKLASFEEINGKGEVVLSKLDYNELGQLKNKSQHSEDKVNFLQATDFAYNERGWLRSSINSQFSMQLDYNENGSGLYNGNIGRQSWSASANPLSSNIYMSYGYDKLNRLTSSIGTGITMNETIAYGVLGNIDRFQRNGGTDNKYHYHGSQLWFAAEVTNGYDYDRNGNAIIDGRTGFHFDYNVLNLPQQVRDANNQNLIVGYTYDAAGSKLKKITHGGTINYIDGIQYKPDNTIDFIQTEEGLARNNGSGNYSYEYNLSDHLGNVRTTFYKNPSTNQLEVLQRDDYYAFGLRNSTQSGNNKYLYNSKEMQEELGQYDYGARFYDPVIGRWNVVDPLAEKFLSLSHYTYVANNPVINIDPDGKDIIGVTKNDAQNFRADIYKVLAGDKFANVRDLIDVKGRSFNHIDAGALTKALDGVTLNADERSYVDMVTNTINSKDIFKVEYVSGDFTSSEGATAFKDHMNKTQAGTGDMMLTPDVNLSSGIVDRLVGLNVPTKDGSHSFISSKVQGNDRVTTSGHELFGHGIPSAKGLSATENNSNAILTDNLIRRLLGLPQRDGKDHGGYPQGQITDPNKLPRTQ